MTYRLYDGLIGYPQIGQVVPTEVIPQGEIQPCYDPVFGGGEVMFVKAGGVIPVWSAVTVLPTWNATLLKYDYIAIVVANAANQSRPLFVAPQAMALNDFGWVFTAGTTPVSCTANVAAAAAVGVAAAGQLGAAAAGKNVFGAVVADPSTKTVVVAMLSGQSGSKQIRVSSVSGLFVGGYVAGTGVGATNFITAIDEINQILTVNVANTGAVSGNLTQTNNNATIFYNTVNYNRPSLTNITV